MIGKLVKRKREKHHKFFGIGIVLDSVPAGRFYPYTELEVYFPCCSTGARIAYVSIGFVEFLNASR